MVGTPSAVPVKSPKLAVMSLRTTAGSASALGPFEPSPGNGPPVSDGTSVVHSAVPVMSPVVSPVVFAVVVSASLVVLAASFELDPHAARKASALPPASNFSATRRSIMWLASNARPRSKS